MQRDEKVRETLNANEWLKRQVQALREDVLTAESRVQKLQENAGLVDATRGGSAVNQQMTQLNVQLVAARAAVTQAEAKLRSGQELLRGGSVESAAGVLASPMLQLLARDQTEIKRKLADMSSQLRRPPSDHHRHAQRTGLGRGAHQGRDPAHRPVPEHRCRGRPRQRAEPAEPDASA